MPKSRVQQALIGLIVLIVLVVCVAKLFGGKDEASADPKAAPAATSAVPAKRAEPAKGRDWGR
mgnify:CR=1 FL=1